ncbi:MAG: reverse transcriptase family protein, partial [Gammaproteobacteria bacterium]|nr:reverse transcriptase family protein [Gammaproteobacteria bacterium]
GITELHIEHAQDGQPPIIEVIKDQAAIEGKITSFYSNLYSRRDSEASAARLEQFIKNSPLIKKLSQEQREKLDMKISEAEVSNYLRGMRNNVAPGSSGYTGNFYKAFWTILKQRIMNAIHKTKEVNCLSASQKIGIVQIIPKADKNLKLLTNWRPLTLLNTFYKLISGVLANRLKSVLDYLIGPEQKGYVPLRFIGEVTRTTYDLFQYAKDKNLPGFILLIDFEKAFDSVSFEMINSTLEMFGFGQYYREWITILLKDFYACVNNSGNISKRFPVQRGCRQGDPISGYLFILCIEVLAIAFKSRSDIKPYKLADGQKHLLDQYADDLTMYLEMGNSNEDNFNNINSVLTTLEEFRVLSGLKVNRGKTMLTIFGCKQSNTQLCKDLGIKWCTDFKLLGLLFDQNLENMEKNYLLAKTKVQAIANSWKNRYVSIYGKVCVIKTLMLPKLTHIATVLPNLSTKQIKEIEQ